MVFISHVRRNALSAFATVRCYCNQTALRAASTVLLFLTGAGWVA